MRGPWQLIRLIHIAFVFARHGLDRIVLSIQILAPLRFLSYLNPWNWFRDKDKSRGECIRHALEELGPIFIKLGQMLSTRRDLLPKDIIDELSLLQDQVPSFPGDIAMEIIEKELGCTIEEAFQHFSVEALASASIAQVHSATLHNGKEVVVKVLRPKIKKYIKRDVRLMYTFARLAQRFWSQGPRLRPLEVVREFERTILAELDLMREAANASQLRRNFKNSPDLYVPKVIWDYTQKGVMVMERISGIPISDVETLKKENVDLKVLAEKGVKIFFTQVFRDRFFHADMHPGNIFVDAKNPKNPRYIAIDFGIMGTLNTNDQRYLAENILAFLNYDYHRVAKLHVDSGWVAEETHLEEFEATIRTVCEPIVDKPLKEISAAKILLRLFQTAEEFHMEIQPQLLLLQKTLLSIEGLGRQLHPDLDIWNTAKPYLEKWMRKQYAPFKALSQLAEQTPYLAEKLPEMPLLIYQALEQIKNQKTIHCETTSASIDQSKIKRSKRRGFFSGIGCTLLLGAGAVYALATQGMLSQPWYFTELPWIIGIMGFISLIFSMRAR